MSKTLLAAALFSLLLVPAHIWGGGPEIHVPMLATKMPADIKAVWSVVWHGISLLLIVNTILLFGGAQGWAWGRATVGVVAAQYFGFAVLFVVYGLLRLGNLTQMPQWIVFLLVAGLIGIDLVRGHKGRAAQ